MCSTEEAHFFPTVCVGMADTETLFSSEFLAVQISGEKGSLTAERKVENHKATPPTLPSDTPDLQTLIKWVEFDV